MKQSILKQIEKLHTEEKHVEIIKLIEKNEPLDYELTCLLARAYCNIPAAADDVYMRALPDVFRRNDDTIGNTSGRRTHRLPQLCDAGSQFNDDANRMKYVFEKLCNIPYPSQNNLVKFTC